MKGPSRINVFWSVQMRAAYMFHWQQPRKMAFAPFPGGRERGASRELDKPVLASQLY